MMLMIDNLELLHVKNFSKEDLLINMNPILFINVYAMCVTAASLFQKFLDCFKM